MSRRVVRELVEVHRVVDRRQVVVEQERRIAVGHLLELALHHGRVFVRRCSAAGEQPCQRLGLGDPLPRVGQVVDVEVQHLPHHPAQVAARIHVIAHERDAARREVLCKHREQAVPHLGRDPGIQPVRDDVVELAGVRPEVDQVARGERDVSQSQPRGRAPPRLDRSRGEVEADELALRQSVGHRQQVCRIAARDLEDAAAARSSPVSCRTAWRWSQAGPDGYRRRRGRCKELRRRQSRSGVCQGRCPDYIRGVPQRRQRRIVTGL